MRDTIRTLLSRHEPLPRDRVAPDAGVGHHLSMARKRTEAEIAAWRAGDAARNERARIERLRRDGARSPSENLAEGIALTRLAHKLAGAAASRKT